MTRSLDTKVTGHKFAIVFYMLQSTYFGGLKVGNFILLKKKGFFHFFYLRNFRVTT